MPENQKSSTETHDAEGRRDQRIVSPGVTEFRCLACGEVRDSKIDLMMHQELWDCGGHAAERARKSVELENTRSHYNRLRKIFED